MVIGEGEAVCSVGDLSERPTVKSAWITLRIAGSATSKKRQRFDPRTKRAYTPPSNIIDENDVRSVWREAGEPRVQDDAAVQLEVLIRVVRPQGHFKKNGLLSTEGQRHPVPRSKKPDVDNALKLIMDALNSRAWRDDVRVARAVVEREWAEWPETIVQFAEYHGPEGDALGRAAAESDDPQVDLELYTG